MRFILKIILIGLSVFGLSQVIPAIQFTSVSAAIWFVFLFTILNLIVKPIFILLTLPITIFTFGIFLIFINAIMILLADYLMDGFNVDGFLWAFIFSILLAIVSWIIDAILAPKEETEE